MKLFKKIQGKLSKKKMSVLCSIVAVMAVFVCVLMVHADTGSNGYGYMWSSNIGWVRLNDCDNVADDSTCVPTASYGVTILPVAPGTISGYAWSPNIGWITFNDPGCPTTGCTPGAHAAWSSDGTTATIEGWARACSVYASGCSGALKSAASLGSCNGVSDWSNQGTYDTGGSDPSCEWDGYIALDSATAGGTAGTWGLTIGTDHTIGGYAWGSEVLGWIHSITAAVYMGGPTARLVPNPAIINRGDSSVLTVTATNIDGANSCNIQGIVGLVMAQGSNNSWTGTVTVSPTTTTTYTVTCKKGTASAKASGTVQVNYFITPPSGGSSGGYCAATYPYFAWSSAATQCTITRNSDGKNEQVLGSSADTVASGLAGTTGPDGTVYYKSTLSILGTGSIYTLQCGGQPPVNTQIAVAECQPGFILSAQKTSANSNIFSPTGNGTISTVSYIVSVTPNNGFIDPVDLAIFSWPTNPALPGSKSATFSPTTLNYDPTTGQYDTATLTISVNTKDLPPSTSPVSYNPIIIQGTNTADTLLEKATVTAGSNINVKPIYNEF